MKTSEYMDKKVMDRSSRSTQKDSYSFFNPNCGLESDDELEAAEGTYGFHVPRPLNQASRSHSSLLRSGNSMDHIDAVDVAREEVGITLLSQINQAMIEHFDKVVHSVDGLGARLSQLESKIDNVENAVENLKVSAAYTNGKTDGKLRQLENILREVQEGINFMKDKQEIAETQFQLAKLQVSKGNRESQETKTVQIEPVLQSSSSAPEQPRPPLLASSSSAPSTYHPHAPSNLVHQQTTHTPVPQNPLPINPHPESYNFPSGTPEPTYQQYNVPSATSGTTYQQYNVPSATAATTPREYSVPSATSETTYHHYNVPSENPHTTYQQYNVPPETSETSYKEYKGPPAVRQPQVPPITPGSYQHASNLPQESQPTHPTPGSYYCQDQPLWRHHPEEKPPMPSHNYPQSALQSSSLPPSRPPVQQFHADSSSQQMHGQPSRSPYPEYPDGYSPILKQSSFDHLLKQDSFDHSLPYGGSSSHYRSSTMNPPQLSPSSSVPGSGSNYRQLPRAQILPDALPMASAVQSGSASGGTGKKNSVDDIVDKVAAMGFRRDQARATIRKLTDDGQAVDLNVVLDKLMNG